RHGGEGRDRRLFGRDDARRARHQPAELRQRHCDDKRDRGLPVFALDPDTPLLPVWLREGPPQRFAAAVVAARSIVRDKTIHRFRAQPQRPRVGPRTHARPAPAPDDKLPALGQNFPMRPIALAIYALAWGLLAVPLGTARAADYPTQT